MSVAANQRRGAVFFCFFFCSRVWPTHLSFGLHRVVFEFRVHLRGKWAVSDLKKSPKKKSSDHNPVIITPPHPITQIQTAQQPEMGDSGHINGNTATYSTSPKLPFSCASVTQTKWSGVRATFWTDAAELITIMEQRLNQTMDKLTSAAR